MQNEPTIAIKPTAEMIEAGWKAALGLNKMQVERIVAAALSAARGPAVTDAMVNAADSVLSRVRAGIPDETIRMAVTAALAAAPAEDEPTEIRPLHPIPIAAAKRIAKEYGYDQVLIYARRCHDTPLPHGEHMTTYGRNPEHCSVAARISETLKKFMGWET